MGKPVYKASPDLDLYAEWSSIVEAPTFIGTRAEMLEHLTQNQDRRGDDTPEVRLARADETGSSSLRDPMSSYAGPLSGAWDDDGEIVEQLGWLPRGRFADFFVAYAADPDTAYKLLDPFADREPDTGEPS